MTNGSCLLVFSLQKSCRGFEHSYTFVLGSVTDSDTDKKWLLKTFAVRFFGTSAEVERCPFVNTSRARHTDAILLSRSMSFWKYYFLAFLTRFSLYFLISCIQIFFFFFFLSLFSLSLSAIVSLMSLLRHGGDFGCFIPLRFKGACLLIIVRYILYHMSPRLYRDQYSSGLQWTGPIAGRRKRQPY